MLISQKKEQEIKLATCYIPTEYGILADIAWLIPGDSLMGTEDELKTQELHGGKMEVWLDPIPSFSECMELFYG